MCITRSLSSCSSLEIEPCYAYSLSPAANCNTLAPMWHNHQSHHMKHQPPQSYAHKYFSDRWLGLSMTLFYDSHQLNGILLGSSAERPKRPKYGVGIVLLGWLDDQAGRSVVVVRTHVALWPLCGRWHPSGRRRLGSNSGGSESFEEENYPSVPGYLQFLSMQTLEEPKVLKPISK